MVQHHGNRLRRADGMTLIELILVIGILTVTLGFAMGVTSYAVKQQRADGAHTAAVAAIELARTRAVSERRDYQLLFTLPNHMQVYRVEVPSGTTTLIYDTYLENGQRFYKFSSIGVDTPDHFGGTAEINLGSTTARFTSDGSMIDASGDVLNGTVYIASPPDVASARAITIFGATGLVHAWKWNGSQWLE
jgi:Tfp pilus assembly protein FimT